MAGSLVSDRGSSRPSWMTAAKLRADPRRCPFIEREDHRMADRKDGPVWDGFRAACVTAAATTWWGIVIFAGAWLFLWLLHELILMARAVWEVI